MHVRISDSGRRLLNNKELASKVVNAIIKNKSGLEKGESIIVNGEHLTIQLTTTIKEEVGKSSKK